MIELIAYGQTVAINGTVGKQHTLDVSNPGALSLTYQIGNVGEVLGRLSPFSQTFRLPFSKRNNNFFSHYYNVNVETPAAATTTNRFDIHFKCDAEIRVDGVPVVTGSLQLKQIHLTAEEYEVVVFGEEANLFQKIKDKKLIDLFFTDEGVQDVSYDVQYSDANIINSFNLSNDVTEGSVGAGKIVFPLIDYGLVGGSYNQFTWENFGQNSGLAAANSNNNPAGLLPYNLKPAIQLHEVVNMIVQQAGYELASNTFLSSDAWTKLYMTLGNDRESAATRGILGVKVGCTAATPISVAAGSTTGIEFTIVPFNDTSSTGFYDEGGHWDTSNYYFTAPTAGTYFGHFVVTFDTTSLQDDYGAYAMLHMGGASNEWSSYANLAPGNGSTTVLTTMQMDWTAYNMEAGEQLYFEVGIHDGAGSGGATNVVQDGTYVQVVASDLVSGYADIANNMPDLTQTAFLKDLVERFNLCIVADQEDPKKLNILPFQSYIDAGEHKDWTHKLDLSKPRRLTTTDRIRKKKIHFTDAEDSTFSNAIHVAKNGFVKGEFKQEIQGDFVQGELKNTPIFAPFEVDTVEPSPGSDMATLVPDLLVHRGFGEDISGAISDAKPKLFYHNGTTSVGGSASIFIGETETAVYPLCLPYLAGGGGSTVMAAATHLLQWEFAPINSFGSNIVGNVPSAYTYFARYWQKFLLSIYDKQARLLECEMLLSASDIFNFKFSDEIQIEDTPYRVLKISNYQPFADVPCKVQLLKKIDKTESIKLPPTDDDCDLVVTGWAQNGTVIFTNPLNGTTSTGTEECCYEYHLFWNGTDCLWNQGTGGHGGGKNPNGGVNPTSTGLEGKSLLTGVGGFKSSAAATNKYNINPISGEHSFAGKNVMSNTDSVQKNFTLYATTYGSTPTQATKTGSKSNTNAGAFSLPDGIICRMVIRAMSIQTDSIGATGSLGSCSFKVWTAFAKNINGTITTSISEQTDFAQNDADAGTRTVALGTTKGNPSILPNQTLGVSINCTGTANTIMSWNIDVEATFMNASNMFTTTDVLLLENLGYIETESGIYLQEE